MARALKRLAGILAYLSLALSGAIYYRVSGHVFGPGAFMLSFPKIIAAAVAPVVAVMGFLGAVMGLAVGAAERKSRSQAGLRIPPALLLLIVAGVMGALLSASYVRQVTTTHSGFEKAFGPGWQAQIPPELGSRMLQRRWSFRLPASLDPRWERDVAFWAIPGSNRKLLADVWQPPVDVRPSGVAYIYVHGGGYVSGDKDAGTRPVFRHLASQGHVIMDVSYRLFPEADLPGMVGDAKRAVAWMKRNALGYGVDPDRIVLGGGSAGGHIALLAAYAPDQPLLTPEDVRGEDLRVRGVVAYYASRLHPTGTKRTEQNRIVEAIRQTLIRVIEKWSGSTLATDAQLLGGTSDEWNERYRLVSPNTYVDSRTPPTLQFIGENDVYLSAHEANWIPGGTALALHRRLRDAGVPSVYVEFARTDHAFDLFANSPPAQAALYDLDRFLALMASPNGLRLMNGTEGR